MASCVSMSLKRVLKKVSLPILIMLITLVISACGKETKREKILVLGTHPCYPPYESISVDGKCEGFDIDVAQKIASLLNKELVIKEFSFDALILALKQNKVDMIMAGISMTPSRQKEIAMISYQGEPITSLFLTFFGEKQEYLSLKELGPIAVQVGTFQEDYLKSLKNISIKSLEGNIEIIMDLQHGKSKAAIFEPHIAQAMKIRFPELHFIELTLAKEDQVLGNGIGIKKDNFLMIEEIMQAVDVLKQNGIINELEKKWFNTRSSDKKGDGS